MKESYIARKIDEEYRKKQMWQKKKRLCKSDCGTCRYLNVCEDREVNDE